MTTFVLRDGTRIRFWPFRSEDQRHPFQVLWPDGRGGASGSGAEAEAMVTDVLAERLAQQAAEGRDG